MILDNTTEMQLLVQKLNNITEGVLDAGDSTQTGAQPVNPTPTKTPAPKKPAAPAQPAAPIAEPPADLDSLLVTKRGSRDDIADVAKNMGLDNADEFATALVSGNQNAATTNPDAVAGAFIKLLSHPNANQLFQQLHRAWSSGE